MKTVEQPQLGLTEDASERLEALLARQVCPQHTGTTLTASGLCVMCALDEQQHNAAKAEEALYAIQSVMAPAQWPDEPTPEWVRRAKAFGLPAKVIS